MRSYSCPNCSGTTHFPQPTCPDCGNPVSPDQWRVQDAPPPPKPTVCNRVELTGDSGVIVFRRHALPMEVGAPMLSHVSSASRCAARVQFILSWEGDSCWIQPPNSPTPNQTFVDDTRLIAKTELRQGQTVCLKGRSGKSAMPLSVLYFP